jgi:hypothetical protein
MNDKELRELDAFVAEHVMGLIGWKADRRGVLQPLRATEASEWRILTVHHLDGNKANCELWNLAALCQRCHLHIQGKVKMDQMFFSELLDVSEWFKPHLQGYLASQKEKASA